MSTKVDLSDTVCAFPIETVGEISTKVDTKVAGDSQGVMVVSKMSTDVDIWILAYE